MKLLDNPEIRRHFAAALLETDVRLPLSASDDEPGFILDARGEIIAHIDVAYLDASAKRLAVLFSVAVNACAEKVTKELAS
jgi:hypothetical protein